ncbi:SET domain-containing protein 3 [Dipsacomyces acuminosporus]|nr:SET domain-containing protein 3 [Dipsacomyces acuminosporus]
MLPVSTAIARDGGGDSTPDEDQGVIRCICSVDDDDGFTIQCENCLVWQHAVCVGVEQDNVPDEYLCEKCNPRKLDVKKAIEYQKRRLDSEYRHSKESRRKPKYVSGKVKKTEDGADRKKRMPDTKQNRTKNTKNAGGRESASPTTMRTGDHRRDSSSIADSSYTPIERNILGADVQVLFQSVLSQLAEQRNVVSAAAASVTSSAVMGQLQSDEPLVSQPTNGIPSTTNSSSEKGKDDHGMHIELPDTAKAAATAAPLIPAVLPMSGEALSSPLPTYTTLVGKDRGQIGLFAREHIARHKYICEYKGQVILKAAYKEDPKNYYDLLRTTRPHSHFHPDIDLCVDARRQGSEARFIRRSCEANVALKSIFVPGSSDALIHLGLFTVRDVEPDEELTVAWEWEEGELPAVARLSPSDAEDYLGKPEGRRMSKVWRQAFNGMACACPDTQCAVRRLFAMFGVEESAVRPEPSSGVKRKVSRPPKVDTSNPGFLDNTLSPPLSPSVRSPDNYRGRSSHSRKASDAAGHDNDYDSINSNTNGVSGHHYQQSNSGKDGGYSSDDENGIGRSINGQSSTAPMDLSSSENGSTKNADRRVRKRKPGHQHDEGNGSSHADPLSTKAAAKGGVSKKHRSLSRSPAHRNSTSYFLPQKKIWMTQYLEHAEHSSGAQISTKANVRIGSAVSAGSPSKSTHKVTEALAVSVANGNKLESKLEAVKAVSESRPASVSSTHSSYSTQITSIKPPTSSSTKVESKEPVSAEPPTDAALSETNAKPGESAQDLANPDGHTPLLSPFASDLPENAAEPANASDKAQPSTESTAANQQVKEPAKPPDSAPAQPPAPPPKKQRLSLQEYNKRRRPPGLENNTKPEDSVAAKNPSPSKVKVTLEEYNRRRSMVTNTASDAVSGSHNANPGQLDAGSGSKPAVALSVSTSIEPISVSPSVTPATASVGASANAFSSGFSAHAGGPTPLISPTSNVGSELSSAAKHTLGIAQPSPAFATAAADIHGKSSTSSRLTPTPPPASSPAFSRSADIADRRGLLTPPPPPPPLPMPNQPSAGWRGQQGASNDSLYRLERGSGAHDDYDRDKDRDSKERDRDYGRDFDYRDRNRGRSINTPPPPFGSPPPPSNSAFQGHMYRPRDRDHMRDRDREYQHRDGSTERESGEIPYGRSRSRDRERGGRGDRFGDRDRRYGSAGSYYSHSQAGGFPPPPPPPLPPGRSLTPYGSGSGGSQRGNGDWRPGSHPPNASSSAAGFGSNIRALSTSPVSQHSSYMASSQGPSASSSAAGAGGYRGFSRRGGGAGTNTSRSGSPPNQK